MATTMAMVGVVRWCKSDLIVSTLFALVILCALYESLSGIFVYSRDAYITTDVIALAPEVSQPLAVLAVKDNQIQAETLCGCVRPIRTFLI